MIPHKTQVPGSRLERYLISCNSPNIRVQINNIITKMLNHAHTKQKQEKAMYGKIRGYLKILANHVTDKCSKLINAVSGAFSFARLYRVIFR